MATRGSIAAGESRLFSTRSFTTCLALAKAWSVASWFPNIRRKIEGQFDWSGSRNLRRFIQTCQEAGLKAFVRCGPWDHGEVRNGGFPDWLLKKGWELRSNDTNYLNKTKIFYGEIARQLNGLLWKNGG